MGMTEGDVMAQQGLMTGDFRAAQQEDLAMQNPENANVDFSQMMGSGVPNDPQAQEAQLMEMQMNPDQPMEQMPFADDYSMEDGELPPELMQQMMGQGQMNPEPPNPAEVLPDVIMSYMDYTMEVRNDQTLNHTVKSDILSKMATAMNSLVPLLNDQAQMDLQAKGMEMQLKQQEHQMNMEMKQMEMQMKMEEHRMKLQMQEEQNQQKLQQSEIQNQQKIVQSQQAHETKLNQQKQAAQSKQGNKHGKD